MLSVSEAIDRLLGQITPVESIRVNISDGLGRVLSDPIFASEDLPLFTNSSMDGFAIKSSDTPLADSSNDVILKVIGDIPAGYFPEESLSQGTAMRIMTGAPLPTGADAVIPVEYTDQSFDLAEKKLPDRIRILKSIRAGDYIRKRGEDIQKGSLVLSLGKRLRPQELGFLAMLGISTVNVYRKPRIAVLSTGEELIPIGSPLGPGKIFDANTFETQQYLRNRLPVRFVDTVWERFLRPL